MCTWPQDPIPQMGSPGEWSLEQHGFALTDPSSGAASTTESMSAAELAELDDDPHANAPDTEPPLFMDGSVDGEASATASMDDQQSSGVTSAPAAGPSTDRDDSSRAILESSTGLPPPNRPTDSPVIPPLGPTSPPKLDYDWPKRFLTRFSHPGA